MCIRLKYQRGYFLSESQFNYLFTLKNANLSSNSYNFWMQQNIAMKSAEYVAWTLICKRYKFGEKNLLPFQRYRIFPRDYFFGAPCISDIHCEA